VKLILESYLSGETTLVSALENLKIKRSRFFLLLVKYQESPDTFTVVPPKKTNDHRKIDARAETKIVDELKKEQKLIQNKDMPIKHYNYSAVRDDLREKHNIIVSVPTIIARAKTSGFWLPKPAKKVHDREVITNFAGELVQHDSSHHLWSPFMTIKLYLITSIDDYSRFLLYADLVEQESSWTHICALESAILAHGAPLKYYADQHSVFRYVRNRDTTSPWYTAQKFTDEVDPQFKQVLKECGTDLIYALSPNAKGKVERPYGWLQDRIVRTCAKEGIRDLKDVRAVLKKLVYQYNYKWVHSTTKEIPAQRLERAIREGKTLFRPFTIKPPFKSSKDIFALRDQRVVDNYRKISIQNFELTVPKVPQRHPVDLRIVPHVKKNIAEVRIWFKNELVSTQMVRHEDIRLKV
jgi:hypothetical protein